MACELHAAEISRTWHPDVSGPGFRGLDAQAPLKSPDLHGAEVKARSVFSGSQTRSDTDRQTCKMQMRTDSPKGLSAPLSVEVTSSAGFRGSAGNWPEPAHINSMRPKGTPSKLQGERAAGPPAPRSIFAGGLGEGQVPSEREERARVRECCIQASALWLAQKPLVPTANPQLPPPRGP